MKTATNEIPQFGTVKTLRCKVYAYLYASISANLDNTEWYKKIVRILDYYSQEESISYSHEDLRIIKNAAMQICDYLKEGNSADFKKDITPCSHTQELMCGLLSFDKNDPFVLTRDKFMSMSNAVATKIIPELIELA